MKNIGTLLSCMVFIVACSNASIKSIKLSDGDNGYDVNCLGSFDKCEQRAKVICETGKFRVHNTFDDALFGVKGTGLTMRMQCLDETASLQQCSQPGVRCIL